MKRRAIPLLRLQAFLACYRVHFIAVRLSNETNQPTSCGNAPVWLVHSSNLDRKTNSCLLHTRYSTPACCAMFLIVNYCSDMFRPQLLAIFRELASFSTCAGHVKLHLCYYVFYIVILSSIYDMIMLYYVTHVTLGYNYVICFVMLHLRYVVFIYGSFNTAVITSRLHSVES